MELLSKLGIFWRLLIAQLINFIALFLILKKFLYRPVLNILKKRQQKIEQSVKDAEEIKKRLAQAEEDYNRIITKANKQSLEIVEKAHEQAAKKEEKMISKAKNEIALIIDDEKAKLQTEKVKTVQEIKKEIADLVVASTEKVLEQKMNKHEEGAIIRKIVE